MSVETFKTIPRLEADDLHRHRSPGAESFRVALKRYHVLASSIQVKRLDASHLKVSWSVDGGTATESQMLTVHWGAVLSLRCPECKEFRKCLFFTTHDDCPFDTNWFHCERCIDDRLEKGKRSRRAKKRSKPRDRRAKRAPQGAVASEPVAVFSGTREKPQLPPQPVTGIGN
jgi:hypothetical protein